MTRMIPLWSVLLIVLLISTVAVGFGWVVKWTAQGAKTGTIGSAAMEIASLPDTTKLVIEELSSFADGSYKDIHNSVIRDKTFDYSNFKEIPSLPNLDVKGLLFDGDKDNVKKGWRFIVGGFSINGNFENAAILLSPDFVIQHIWVLNEIPVGGHTPRPKFRKFVHGIEVLKDGSIIFAYDGAISLQRFDACANRMWTIPGEYSHSVTLEDDHKSVWALVGHAVARVAVADGEILNKFSFYDIQRKNPLIDILEVRRFHDADHLTNSKNTNGLWLLDRFHSNDVEPLPEALAGRFPGFDAGDLVLSLRSLNLVFVVDPDTHVVKWWRSGFVQRQHDPDFLPNGKISVFDNRMSRDFSQIVTIDPQTFKTETLFDGRKNNFYTRIRGKHQILEDGTLIVTSPQQGRVFEVNADGEVVLEIINTKPGSDEYNYVISEMKWLPTDYFEKENWQCASDDKP